MNRELYCLLGPQVWCQAAQPRSPLGVQPVSLQQEGWSISLKDAEDRALPLSVDGTKTETGNENQNYPPPAPPPTLSRAAARQSITGFKGKREERKVSDHTTRYWGETSHSGHSYAHTSAQKGKGEIACQLVNRNFRKSLTNLKG